MKKQTIYRLIVFIFICVVSGIFLFARNTEFHINVVKKVHPPDWLKKTVVYQIYPRSYADTNGDTVGDLKGVTSKLSYISALGIGTIWLTPIFVSPSEHGYDTADYYQIDPELGSKEDLIALVDEAHKKNIRVILDFVSSHISNTHPFFTDAFGNTSSRYSEWFIWKNAAHTQYASFGNNPAMPRLNLFNTEVQTYLIAVATYWAKTAKIDGYRCDFVTNPTTPHDFWRILRRGIKAINSDIVLVAEAWTNLQNIAPYYDDQFDATFNFPAYQDMQGSMFPIGEHMLLGERSFREFATTLQAQSTSLATDAIRMFFLNSHDTNRVMSQVFHDGRRARMAALLLLTMPDTPVLYYGEEIGERGIQTVTDGVIHSEPVRGPMIWFTEEHSPENAGQTEAVSRQLDGESTQSAISARNQSESLLNYYQTLIQTRNTHEALHSGTFHIVSTDDQPFAFAFARKSAESIFVTTLNTQNSPITMQIHLSSLIKFNRRITLENSLTHDTVACNTHVCAVSVPEVSGALWEVRYK